MKVLEGLADSSLRAFALADFSSQNLLSPDVCIAGSSLFKAQLQRHLLRDTFRDPHFKVASLPSHDAPIPFSFGFYP